MICIRIVRKYRMYKTIIPILTKNYGGYYE